MEGIITLKRNYRDLTVKQSFEFAGSILLERIEDPSIRVEIEEFTNDRIKQMTPILNIKVDNVFSIEIKRKGVYGFTTFLTDRFYKRLVRDAYKKRSLSQSGLDTLTKEVKDIRHQLKKVRVA